MTAPMTDQQRLTEARSIARNYGMVISEKTCSGQTKYTLFRIKPHGGVIAIGQRSSPQGMRQFVARVAKVSLSQP